jgi:hypothetical protein
MKNKKLLYGVLLAGAVVGLYMWNKSKKKETCSCSSSVKPEQTPISETYANAGGGKYGMGCKVCERADSSTYFARFGGCNSGDSCITSKRPKKLTEI